jgi:hypothetical protein
MKSKLIKVSVPATVAILVSGLMFPYPASAVGTEVGQLVVNCDLEQLSDQTIIYLEIGDTFTIINEGVSGACLIDDPNNILTGEENFLSNAITIAGSGIFTISEDGGSDGASTLNFRVTRAYSNEDGENIYVDNCDGANFTVTIDGTEYGPGDVASGFSLSSTYSVSAGEGVTVGWVPASVVQGSYGHGRARNPLEGRVLNFDAASDWLTLNQSSFMSFWPGIFFAECPGEDGFAYIQTFPGLPLDEAGFNFNLVDGLSSSDGGRLDPDEVDDGGYVFTPMSNFRNSAYAFWSNWVEDLVDDNPSAIYSFQEPLWGNVVQGVWVYVITEDEFASSFYSYSNGSDELTEIGIDDVFEEEAAPTTAPASSTPSTTPTTLAATGADVELLLLASLIAVVAGAGLFAFSRRKRIW